MKSIKIDSSSTRQILISMIMSDEFLSGFAPICDTALFPTSQAKLVSDWCLSYFRKYNKAPKRDIQGIYETQKDKLEDTTSDLIAEMLSYLSDEFESGEGLKENNTPYLLDVAEEYMKKRNIQAMLDKAGGFIDIGEVLQAEALISNFHNVSRPDSNGISLLRDLDEVKKYFQKDKDLNYLFKFPGALGRLITEQKRGQLLGILAPKGRGKSWWLIFIACVALLNQLKVCFISLEMGMEEVCTRFVQYFTGQPTRKKYLGCDVPYLDRDGKICTRPSDKELLTFSDIESKLKKLRSLVRGGDLEILCWPSDTKSLLDINSQLDIWSNEDNFNPDVIVIDYADLLSPVDKRLEYRHQLDSIWKGLKRLSQERHSLVATASQSNKETHKKRVGKDSIAEDKRKGDHCDRMIALNQSDSDKKRNLMRVGIVFERHDEEQSWNEVVVLQQPAIGRPYLGSFIKERKNLDM